MDKQIMIATILDLIAICIIAIIQYKLGYENGYSKGTIDAKREFKEQLDKVLEEMKQECTVSTED